MTELLTQSVLPDTATTNAAGNLELGGCDAVELANTYGTPLYVYDEATIRARASGYRERLSAEYPNSEVLYASKAYLAPWLLRLIRDLDLGLDVVSGGELEVARRVGFPMGRVYFHGNNKGRDELAAALAAGIGRVVVDSFHELDLLADLAAQAGVRQRILIRLSPGVEAHTHDYRKTGILDSKFGFPIVTGQAEEAVVRALGKPSLELLGFHAHIGSGIFDLEGYLEATAVGFDFAREMYARHGLVLQEYSPGGGWGIAYTADERPLPIADIMWQMARMTYESAERVGLDAPRLVIEPGRSIVGSAGVALYTVGAIKVVPGLRTFVSLDGGMADNIRPAIYGAKYEALFANRPNDPLAGPVTLAGKYCESGDILIRDIDLPAPRSGDIVAIPASGAYNLAMASNYNLAFRPAVVVVAHGQHRLVRRRETVDDLLATEL